MHWCCKCSFQSTWPRDFWWCGKSLFLMFGVVGHLLCSWCGIDCAEMYLPYRCYWCSCHKQGCSQLVWPWSAADPLGIKQAWSEIPAVKYFALLNMSRGHFLNADWLHQYLSNPVQTSWSELLCGDSRKTPVLWRLGFGVLKDYRNLNLLSTWVFIFWKGSAEMFSHKYY